MPRDASYPLTVDPILYSQVIKLTPSDAMYYDYFGWSVAISGDNVVVGSPWEDGLGTDRGAAYVFTAGTYSVYLLLVLRS